MKENKNKEHQFYYISFLRENLREQAVELAEQLSRSVTLLTSYDNVACEEYDSEVSYQLSIAEKLFYVQQCRNALEQCIAKEKFGFRYYWKNGAVTVTKFWKTAHNCVKVVGLRKNDTNHHIPQKSLVLKKLQ